MIVTGGKANNIRYRCFNVKIDVKGNIEQIQLILRLGDLSS